MPRKSMVHSRGKVPFQVILPQARVDLFDYPSLFQMEWRREFPNEFAQVEKFYEELRSSQDLSEGSKKEGNFILFLRLTAGPIIRKWFSSLSFPEAGTDQRLSSVLKGI